MKKKIKYIVFILIVCIFILCFTDFYTIFVKPLDIGKKVDKNYGDVILVLGGGLRPKVEIGYSTGERLRLAARLFKQKKMPIIISDGSLYKGSPAIKKMKEYLLKHNIKDEYILIEGKSQTTFDNCVNAKKIIDKNHFKELIICTSPYHQKRTELILKYLNFKKFKIAKMHNSEIYQANNIKQRLRNFKLILREYLAIVKLKIFKK